MRKQKIELMKKIQAIIATLEKLANVAIDTVTKMSQDERIALAKKKRESL